MDGQAALPPAHYQSTKTAATDRNVVFQPGDRLELYVEEDSSFNSIYLVRPGGYILIPRLGRIQVAGLNREAAENALTQVLQKNQLTKAKVLVEHVSDKVELPGPPGVPKFMVFITGAVPRSGVHYLPLAEGRSTGVYETLLITGGTSKFANLGSVEVFRTNPSGRRVRAQLDLRPIRDGKADDPLVGDGDIIHVSEKTFGF